MAELKMKPMVIHGAEPADDEGTPFIGLGQFFGLKKAGQVKSLALDENG